VPPSSTCGTTPLLRRPLAAADTVRRGVLGHWGTQPGLNLVYAHLNRLIVDRGCETLLVVGPGHGAPAIYANLFLEGTLAEIDPRLARDESGTAICCVSSRGRAVGRAT